MATTNSKSFFDLPMSTKLMRVFFELWNLELFLFFNPLTLWLVNLFAPRWAVCIAHDKDLYGKTSQKFFERQAKKWPWHWAKWWYKLDELKILSEKHQIDYYNNVNSSIETLMAMRTDVAAKVLDDDFAFFKENVCSIKLNAELFRVFIAKSIEQQDWSAFEEYLKRGTLPKDQVVILAHEACHVSVFFCGWRKACVTGVFLDYVERCGLNNELRHEIGKSMWCNDVFLKEFRKRLNIYDQRVFTKSQRGSKQTDAWLSYCETTKDICPQAQMEMGLDQYHVFHKTGHTLDAEAILHILQHNSDRTMAKLIFEYEPNFGVANENIKEFVGGNQALSNLLNTAVITPIQEDLRQRICKREELTEEQINKMFDCPDAAQMALDYIVYYPLPKAFHKRLLEPENDGVLQFYISQGWLLSAYQLDEAVAEECKKRGYRLDPPEEDSYGEQHSYCLPVDMLPDEDEWD